MIFHPIKKLRLKITTNCSPGKEPDFIVCKEGISGLTEELREKW